MKIRKLAIALGLGLGLTAGSAMAGPINLGQWYTFAFGGAGGALGQGGTLGQQSLPVPAAPWTFDCPVSRCLITVTDGFQAGDEFRLFDFANLLGDTGAVATDENNQCSNNEVACLASVGHSDGAFIVLAGAHSISGIVTDSPFGGGAAFLRVDRIPEPGTLALLGLALAGFGLRRARSA